MEIDNTADQLKQLKEQLTRLNEQRKFRNSVNGFAALLEDLLVDDLVEDLKVGDIPNLMLEIQKAVIDTIANFKAEQRADVAGMDELRSVLAKCLNGQPLSDYEKETAATAKVLLERGMGIVVGSFDNDWQ